MSLGALFPGQGSQKLGMGSEFVHAHAAARQLFEEAEDALHFDLLRLCLEGPLDELTRTPNAQAAILTVATIAQRLLSAETEFQPTCVAGHSVGEYSAIVAAGALDFRSAVRTVHARGRLMEAATPPGVGAMAAILGAEATHVEALCAEEAQQQIVCVANYNAPGQIVVSGHTEAVLRVLARARGKLLQVSAPFHSPLLEPAAEQMGEVLAQLHFEDAQMPVVANLNNAFLTRGADFPVSLQRQIPSPVRWESGIRAMCAAGVEVFVECGHSVLCGMMRRIAPQVKALPVYDLNSLEAALSALSTREGSR